jgi:hypothetical protein
MKEVNYIIAIGYNCDSDDFLYYNNIRLFSTPFSYMLIDFETVICNLANSFRDYLKIEYIKNRDENLGGNINKVEQFKHIQIFKRGSQPFYSELYINTNFLPDNIIEDIYEWDRICILFHHNMNDPTVMNNFKRRIERIQYILNNYKDKALFFHIDKQHKLCQIDDKIKEIANIMGKYSVDYNICYVLPIKDYSGEPKLYSEVGNIKLFIVRMSNNNNDIIDWNGFYKLISEHYIFNLVQVETCQNYDRDTRIKEMYNKLLSRDPTESESNHFKKLLVKD